MVTLRYKQFSDLLTQNVDNSGMGYLLSLVKLYEIGMRMPFPKQYRCVAYHLHLYAMDYYIFASQLPSQCAICPEIQHLQLL